MPWRSLSVPRRRAEGLYGRLGWDPSASSTDVRVPRNSTHLIAVREGMIVSDILVIGALLDDPSRLVRAGPGLRSASA